MRQLLLIDPIENLNVRKDSSMMLALAMQKKGIETYVFFENDFAIQNQGPQKLTVHSFEGTLEPDGFYMKSFKTTASKTITLKVQDVVHMRLDPPFDSRYLRILWMLDHWMHLGIKVMNDPKGIMMFNEKLYAYRSMGATPSYIGQNVAIARDFVKGLKPPAEALILKPMDLYSGIGVEKLDLDKWEGRFVEKVKELKGPVIVQPYIEAVT